MIGRNEDRYVSSSERLQCLYPSQIREAWRLMHALVP
jgi:hypothetical protein